MVPTFAAEVSCYDSDVPETIITRQDEAIVSKNRNEFIGSICDLLRAEGLSDNIVGDVARALNNYYGPSTTNRWLPIPDTYLG
jgi:hypothetical protein